MRIRYRNEEITVDYIQSDESDPDMPLCVLFPKGHKLHDPNGTWLEAEHLEILED